jgi:hypothetical protein
MEPLQGSFVSNGTINPGWRGEAPLTLGYNMKHFQRFRPLERRVAQYCS